MFWPIIYTVFTTVFAFLSLIFSGIKPIIDFGWMMTIGISLALLIAFIVIPAGMLIFGKNSHNAGKDNSSAITGKFAWFTEHYGTAVLLIAAGLSALSVYGINQLEVENRFIDYFRSDTEIYQGMRYIDEQLAEIFNVGDWPALLKSPVGQDIQCCHHRQGA